MGGKRSSSKRKSSKRKSSKISSEARRKKRSRKNKSKKLRNRNDSSSDSSDDSSSVSISSSSFEDEYRRAGSRTRSGVKGSSRKRTRRSSSNRGSSEENSHVKKRKGSKRSANSDSKTKSQKKRRKREPNVSSVSSDSRSCSTCRGERSGGDSEFERPRARSREKSKEKRNLDKAKGDKNRSRSCSPCTGLNDSGDHNSNEVLPVENSVRRLRSVITVPKSSEGEEKDWEKDGRKEKIAYDHDDYPSCRSNDSNEGGSKTEIASLDPLDKWVENARRGEALVSDIGMTKTREEDGIQVFQSKFLSNWSGANDYIKETKVDVLPTVSGTNDDDLESVLRLKALENLKKYRDVRLQTNAKPHSDEITKSGNEVKRLSTAKVDFVQNTSTNEDDSTVVGATRVLDQNRRSKMGRDFSFPATSYGKGQEGQGIVTERDTARLSLISLPNKLAISGNSKKEDPSPASDLELGKSALRQEASETILNHAQKANMLVSEGDVEKRSVETCKGASQAGGDNNRVNNVGESSISKPSSSLSSLKPILEEQNSQDQQCRQFEQKTMSVMRGGEMVEVSYKVYIPKKAPSLTRRHLRR